MSDTKHTPGPWMAATAISSVVGLPVVAPKGRLICNVNHAHDPMHGKVSGDDDFNREARANARLIAAAPELLQILKDITTAHRRDEPMGRDLDRAIELIAKAEGRS